MLVAEKPALQGRSTLNPRHLRSVLGQTKLLSLCCLAAIHLALRAPSRSSGVSRDFQRRSCASTTAPAQQPSPQPKSPSIALGGIRIHILAYALSATPIANHVTSTQTNWRGSNPSIPVALCRPHMIHIRPSSRRQASRQLAYNHTIHPSAIPFGQLSPRSGGQWCAESTPCTTARNTSSGRRL